MHRYATHDWRSEPTNLLVTSPTGAGKTYLVCAIGTLPATASTTSPHLPAPGRPVRRPVIACTDGIIAHQDLLTRLSETDLLIIDDFLTVGIDPEAASDLFAILANPRAPPAHTDRQPVRPDYWAQTLPTGSPQTPSSTGWPTTPGASTSARSTCRQRGQQARTADGYWE